MALPLPTSLSPSKVASFKDCALAFRFSAIDRLPEPPSPAATKGTLVHRALELLFCEPRRASARSPSPWPASTGPARRCATDPEFAGLDLDAEAEADVRRRRRGRSSGATSSSKTPRTIRPIGLELMLEAQRRHPDPAGHHRPPRARRRRRAGRHRLQDRARSPGSAYEQSRLGGVHFYAFLCEQVLGRRPAPHPAALPERAGGHRGRAVRPVDPRARSSARRPSGRRSSGRASTRTSGPARRGCATGARSRPTAPPSAATRPGARRADGSSATPRLSVPPRHGGGAGRALASSAVSSCHVSRLAGQLRARVSRFDTRVDRGLRPPAGPPGRRQALLRGVRAGRLQPDLADPRRPRGLRSERDWHAAVRLGGGRRSSRCSSTGSSSRCSAAPAARGTVERPLRLRRPRTSSFPSGHATSAFSAAPCCWPRTTPCGRCTTRSPSWWLQPGLRQDPPRVRRGGRRLDRLVLGRLGRRLMPLVPPDGTRDA